MTDRAVRGPHRLRLTVNGERRLAPDGTTLAVVIAEVAAQPRGVAVAVNDVVVPRSEWGGLALCDDDRVEILTAVQGG